MAVDDFADGVSGRDFGLFVLLCFKFAGSTGVIAVAGTPEQLYRILCGWGMALPRQKYQSQSMGANFDSAGAVSVDAILIVKDSSNFRQNIINSLK